MVRDASATRSLLTMRPRQIARYGWINTYRSGAGGRAAGGGALPGWAPGGGPPGGATFTTADLPSGVATVSPGCKVGSLLASRVTRPNESLPLQVQPPTICLR